jgi:hypothetical protein
MSSESADNPSDKPGRFDSPVPESWAQPVPDSWTSQSWSPQPDGSGAPPPPPRPGHQAQQPSPAAGPGPAAADQRSHFPQAGAGQPQSGQYRYSPYGQYPPGQHGPNGQHGPDGQHGPNGQHPPGGQYPPAGQYAPGPYGNQWQYFTPPAARNNRVALAALMCGIGQFLLGLTGVGNILLAIPAIICGSIALKQIRLRGERGHGMAVAGLVLGILGVAYFLLILFLIVVGMQVSRHSS